MKIEKHFQGLQLSPKPSLCERGGAKKVVCVKWSVNCQLVIGVEEKAIEIGGRVEISYKDRRRCPLKEQKPPPPPEVGDSVGVCLPLFIQYQITRQLTRGACRRHPHQQMEVTKRLKMETQTGVSLCYGILSQNSQESSSKCACQGCPWPFGYQIKQTLCWWGARVSWGAHLLGDTVGRCPFLTSQTQAVAWLPWGFLRAVISSLGQ